MMLPPRCRCRSCIDHPAIYRHPKRWRSKGILPKMALSQGEDLYYIAQKYCTLNLVHQLISTFTNFPLKVKAESFVWNCKMKITAKKRNGLLRKGHCINSWPLNPQGFGSQKICRMILSFHPQKLSVCQDVLWINLILNILWLIIEHPPTYLPAQKYGFLKGLLTTGLFG